MKVFSGTDLLIAAHCEDPVIIAQNTRLAKGKYIIAPDDPSFFDELQSRLLIEKVE
jgi:hypothetical protein